MKKEYFKSNQQNHGDDHQNIFLYMIRSVALYFIIIPLSAVGFMFFWSMFFDFKKSSSFNFGLSITWSTIFDVRQPLGPSCQVTASKP